MFFVGLAVVVLAVLREAGIELPPAMPESLVVIALGALGDDLRADPADLDPRQSSPARAVAAIGIWISLIAAICVIVAGLLRAAEEL